MASELCFRRHIDIFKVIISIIIHQRLTVAAWLIARASLFLRHDAKSYIQ